MAACLVQSTFEALKNKGSRGPPYPSQNQSRMPYPNQGPPTGIIATPFSPYPNQPPLTPPYPPQSASYIANPSASYPSQSMSGQPTPYTNQPPQSASYIANPSASYPSQSVSDQPAPFSNQPAYDQPPYPNHPAYNLFPYPNQPAYNKPPYNPSQPAYNQHYPVPSQPACNQHCLVPSQPAYHSGHSSPNQLYPGHQTGPYPPHSYGNSTVASSTSSYPIVNPSLSNVNTLPLVAELTPTVLHNPKFNVTKDAKVLKKAMKGLGTNEKAIINILANRNNEHRLKIVQEFRYLYDKNLITKLNLKLSGRFKDLIVAMMTPIAEFYAQEIHNATSGIKKDNDCLIQCLCSLKNQDIKTICQVYEEKYNRSLEKDICNGNWGYFQDIFFAVCAGNRDESDYVDVNAAKKDAMKLYEDGIGRSRGDGTTFISIVAQRNFYQSETIFQEYHRMYKHTVYDLITQLSAGKIASELSSIVKCVTNSAEYFAERLYKCMDGIETKDAELIRLVVTRSEVDMGDIDRAFVKLYGKTLKDHISEIGTKEFWNSRSIIEMGDIKQAFVKFYRKTLKHHISKDTSGDYKKCLVALIS